tara:strand:+ start:551 stop:2209 length:1659 start_codon:yes stop_codon:yes gene_type:complete
VSITAQCFKQVRIYKGEKGDKLAMNLPKQLDVIMIYQEKDIVESAIQQIMELKLKFKAYEYNPKKLHEIAQMKPKVLLLSSNNIKNTIQFYIDYLEDYGQNIAHHSAVLLINNRETFRAYLACENGLFDNYAIINPLNEPFRLKLVLLQELKLIESHSNEGLEQLISDGEDELASCIEHGLALKKSFQTEVSKCEENISLAATQALGSKDATTILQNIVGLSLEEMNENVSASIQNILEQLLELKANNKAIQQGVEQFHTPTKKTTVGINTELLISDDANEQHQSTRYKVLIAEPTNMFAKVIDKIFSETVFKYLLVNDGKIVLDEIKDFEPDVVLLAYDLPSFDGIEITQIIRDEGNNVPIVAYVLPKDTGVIKRWTPLGLSSYLIKPSKKSAILQNIMKALKTNNEQLSHHNVKENNSIEWLPKYAVGNKEIDEQHKVLFIMINDFYHQESKDEAIILFHNVYSYIDLQFESEENLLRQINYPETEQHIKEHFELREKLDELAMKLNNYDFDIQHKIAMFIYSWLTAHILKSDMGYRAYALSIEEESFSE